MSLEKAIELICSLLIPQTYTDLQRAEEELKEQGIDIKDDFVLTEERKRVLANIETQFTSMIAPTAILTGWFGSGKTALLNRIMKDLSGGRLLYGGRQLDTVFIQLNVQNTLSLFLARIFDSIADLKGADWVVEQFRKTRAFIDLPDVTPTDTRGLVEALVQMPPIRMAEVAQFLDELFEQYKRSTKGTRILALIIDELENLTRKSQLEGEDKLVELLRILIDNAVREYKDHLTVTRDPKVIVLFSITSRRELAGGEAGTGWFPQDTLERMKAVEQNVNLSPQAAEYLMKRILRIYFTSVVDGLLQKSTDGRLRRWSDYLSSASDTNDVYYTYPIMPEVHRFFVSRLLKLSADGQVLTFRAYQVGMHTLLCLWQGEQPIDPRFMVAHYDELVYELEQYPRGVILDNLIGIEQIHSFVERKFPQLKPGQRFQLGTITHLAITRGTIPIASITRGQLEEWLPEGEVPSEAAFRELLESVKRVGLNEWDVTGDTIYVNVQNILSQLSQYAEKVSPEKKVEELVNDTKHKRAQMSVTELFRDSLEHEREIRATCDDLGILLVTDTSTRGQLIGTTFLAFDMDEGSLYKRVCGQMALCPAIVFCAAEGATQSEFPFEVSVLLPPPLQDKGNFYAAKIKERIQQFWEDSFYPLISTIVRLEKCAHYDAFKEALKVMLLLAKRPRNYQEAFKDFNRNLRQIILDLRLTDTDKERWICHKLGFVSFHPIDCTLRLIKVLSWRGDENESILYDNSDEVQPLLYSRFDVPLPTPAAWRGEIKEEWENEDFITDGKITPFSKWSEERRRLYDRVNAHLREQPLSFYEVGKLAFGQTRIDNLDRARVALHLFLKLGKISPWNWTLTDDRHDYKDMQVRSGELRQKELVKQFANQSELKLLDLVLAYYLASPSARSQLLDDILQVLKMRAQLNDDTPIPVLQEWADKLAAIVPKTPKKHIIERALIQGFPSHMSKVAEFLEKVRRMLQGESALSYAVSRRVPDLIAQVSVDVDCERLFKCIEQLYKNWGKEVPFELDGDRFLVRLYKDYTSRLSDIPNWEKQKAEQCDSQFREKILHLTDFTEQGLEEALNSICTWLDECARGIIKSGWKATYTEDDRARLEQFLKNSLEQASREVVELRNEIEAQLEVLDKLKANPLLMHYSDELRDYGLRLQQDLTSLGRIQERLGENQFGLILRETRNRLSQWDQLKAEMLQSQSSMVNAWLQEHPQLVSLKEQILENLANVTMPLNKLSRQMTEAGSDPIELLLAGEIKDFLALFAAAQLLNALEEGEVI